MNAPRPMEARPDVHKIFAPTVLKALAMTKVGKRQIAKQNVNPSRDVPSIPTLFARDTIGSLRCASHKSRQFFVQARMPLMQAGS